MRVELLLADVDVLGVPQTLNLVLRQVAISAVEVALEQTEHAAVELDDGAKLDLIDGLGTPALVPVVLETLGDEADGRVVAAQRVGAGARLVLGQPDLAPVAVLLVLLHERRVDDVDLGHDGQEDGRRLGEGELDGVIVGRLGRARLDERREEGRGLAAGREDALHGIDDVGSLDLGAVVEFGALAQLERVGLPILRDGVALGQPGFDLGGIVEPAQKAVVHVDAGRDAADIEDHVRIEVVVRARVGEHELRFGAGGCHRHRDERGCCKRAKPKCFQCASTSYHVVLSLCPGATFRGCRVPVQAAFSGNVLRH